MLQPKSNKPTAQRSIPAAQEDRAATRLVARSAALVAAFFTADKVLGLVRDVVVSRAFGTSAELDAYYAAFELPDGLFTVLAGSAMATSLIPILAGHISKGRREEVGRLTSAVLNVAMLVAALVSVVAILFAPHIINLVAPGFDVYRADLATRLMRLVLLQTVVFIASAIMISFLHAHQHFLLPALAPLAYTLGRIVGALFLAPHWGIFGIAWGGVLGTMGHFLIQLPGLLRYRFKWTPVWRHPDFSKFLTLMGPRILSVAVTYLNFVLPTFWGSNLVSGSISAYEYSWRLMQFPETIIGTALGLTIYPTLAKYANAQDQSGLRRTGGWALRLVLTFSIPAAAGLLLLGRPMTAIFLQRGAFDANATERVYWALQFLALGLIAHTALEVVARCFYAQRDMWTPFWAALAGLGVNAGLGWLLLNPLEHGAIALANSLGASLQVVILLLVMQRRMGGLETRPLLKSVLQTMLATALMTLAIVGTRYVFAAGGMLLQTLASLGGGLLVYLLAAWFLGNETLRALPRLLWSARD